MDIMYVGDGLMHHGLFSHAVAIIFCEWFLTANFISPPSGTTLLLVPPVRLGVALLT